MTWILEMEAFPNGDCLAQAATLAGDRVIAWQDEWWPLNSWPKLDQPCLFHGSLGNADRVRRELPWRPGAFCNTTAFACSAWYPHAKESLLHDRWEVIPAARLVETAEQVFDRFGGDAVFARPDSPLKPFSGRVVKRGKLTLAALDHGFYYEDTTLPVVVAPVREVKREWRYVVVDRRVVAGSGYLPDGRTATPDSPSGEPWKFAARVAQALPPPDPVYVLDVCESPDGLHLLELNPFSGADLYACDGSEIVGHVHALLMKGL
jgi:hypothetical protein